eukprot:1943645-Prymnesium_polylepis.1
MLAGLAASRASVDSSHVMTAQRSRSRPWRGRRAASLASAGSPPPPALAICQGAVRWSHPHTWRHPPARAPTASRD